MNTKHILTKEDFANYPEMSLQGWKVGDEVEIMNTIPPYITFLFKENVAMKLEIQKLKNELSEIKQAK